MLGLFAVFLLCGSPIGYAMGLSAAIALLVTNEAPLMLLPQLFYTSAADINLLAVPLFILAGGLMSESGITESIIRVSRAFAGHLKGGLAKANIMTNTFMAAISGSAVADAAAVGSVIIPAMKEEGYTPEFAVAVTGCSAMLAPILPPSIIAIVYASQAGLSIGHLFMAGIVPGLLGGVAFFALVHFLSGRSGAMVSPRVPARERYAEAVKAAPAAFLPVLIVGSLMSGIATPTETAAIAVAYAMVVAAFRRRFRLAGFYQSVVSAAVLSSSILVVIAGAALFGWVLTRAGAPQYVMSAILQISDDPNIVLLIVLVALFVLGTVLEPAPALILLLPLLIPIVSRMGYEPYSFAIAVIMMLVLGSVTPPVGVLTMVCANIAGIEYSKTFRAVVPFIAVWCALALLVAYIPQIASTLPALVF
jgi:tripartite ATP-independent transporter DctM subunit